MPAQIFDLADDLTASPPKRDAIEQGADFAWTVRFAAADVTGTDAADWLARMQVRRTFADQDTGEPLVDLDSAAKGGIAVAIETVATVDYVVMTMSVDDTVTEDLPVGKWHYDLELVRLADGYVRRVAKGRAQVVAEVTR